MLIRFSGAFRIFLWVTSLTLCEGLGSESRGSTTYISSVDGSNSGGFMVGTTPVAESFRTGGASGGYLLDSVSLFMGGRTTGASGFRVAIYSDQGAGVPWTQLGLLAGNNNPGSGLFEYSGLSLFLDRETTYWVVASANNTGSFSGYTWGFSQSVAYTGTDGWSIDIAGYCEAAINFGRWGAFSPYRNGLLQLSVSATPVPEPASWALLVGATALMICQRRLSPNPAANRTFL